MIDIDCHARGTQAGAMAFAEHLRANPLFGDDLYVETSTNGVGVHGYIVVVKGCASDRITNVALKVLDLYLKGLSYLGDFDIELVEVKGTCPELTWGRERGRLEKYQSGQLAKLPREALGRTDELMGTSKLHVSRLATIGARPRRDGGGGGRAERDRGEGFARRPNTSPVAAPGPSTWSNCVRA